MIPLLGEGETKPTGKAHFAARRGKDARESDR